MISLIAPAKTLDYESDLKITDFSVASHLKDSKILIKELQNKSPDELSSLMGLSEKLSTLNFERNMNWKVPKKPSSVSRQAIYAFKGDVYMGLEAETLSKRQINYAQKHLAILSGLYGLLKPLDLIYPYRLEMGTKMKNSKGKNLYEFWGTTVTDAINAELKEGELFLNLASAEYFKVLQPKNIKGTVISPVFKDLKNGKLKIISFFAKKARGGMTRYVINTNAQTLDDIKGFDYDGYRFSQQETTKEHAPVFIR